MRAELTLIEVYDGLAGFVAGDPEALLTDDKFVVSMTEGAWVNLGRPTTIDVQVTA